MGKPYHSGQKHTPEGSPQKAKFQIPCCNSATGTKKGAFTLMPLPKINELLALLKGAKYFTAPDL